MIFAVNLSSAGNDVKFVVEHQMKDGTIRTNSEGMTSYGEIVRSNIYVMVKETYKRLFFYTTEAGIIEAIAKRFRSGNTHLKNGLTIHKFLVDHKLVVSNRCYEKANPRVQDQGIELITIPSKPSNRTEDDKRFPMHTAIFITDAEANAKVVINNPKNCNEVCRVLEDGDRYQVDVFFIRWAGWKFMNYRAAIKATLYPEDEVKKATTYYEFGWISDEKDGYAKDCLVKLSADEQAQFDQYEKELAEKQARSEEKKKLNGTVKPYNKPQKPKYQKSNQGGYKGKPRSTGGYRGGNNRGSSQSGYNRSNYSGDNRNNAGNYRGNGNRNVADRGGSGYKNNTGSGYRNTRTERNSNNRYAGSSSNRGSYRDRT